MPYSLGILLSQVISGAAGKVKSFHVLALVSPKTKSGSRGACNLLALPIAFF
jgi:hypothetical protein